MRRQHRTQPGDVTVQGGPGGRRRVVRPQQVDEALDGDCLAGVEQEYAQQQALAASPEAHRAVTGLRLQRPEQPKLHGGPQYRSRSPVRRPDRPPTLARHWQGGLLTMGCHVPN